MRRHLQTALESHFDRTPFGEISLEEEMQNLVEATGDEALATADLAEAERMGDISDALEDLAVVADGIEEPTAVETQLMDSVGQMAVTGTDVPPDEIVPAMESFSGGRVAMESVISRIRETAARIWAEIKRIVKKVWDYVESYFYKVFGTIPSLRKRIKALKERVDQNSGTMENKKITITGGVGAVCVDYKAPSNAGGLKSAQAALDKENDEIYDKSLALVEKIGEGITEALNEFDPAKPNLAAVRVRKVIASELDKLVTTSTGSMSKSTRWSGFDAAMSPPLPGNVSIAARVPSDLKELTKGDTPSVQMLDAGRRFVVELVPTSDKPKDVPSSFEMSTMTNSEMDSLLTGAEKTLDLLEKFQRGKRYNELKAIRKKLETASEKATKAVEKLDANAESEDRKAIPYYRAILNFNTSFARWTKDPAAPLLQVNLAFIRGVMTCCEKSLAAYK